MSSEQFVCRLQAHADVKLSDAEVAAAKKKKRKENPGLGEDVELSPEDIVVAKKKQWADSQMSYALGAFFLTQRLAQLAQAQLQALGSATWAGMAQLHAQGEHALFRARLVELTRLTVVLGASVLVPIVVYNPRFVAMWVGPVQFAGMTLTSISALNALLLSVTALWGLCYWLYRRKIFFKV